MSEKANHSEALPAGPAAAGGHGLPQAPETSIADCWNTSGVHGDRSCPQLEQFVHCRNCPVYSSAASQLLNRSLPAQYRAAWTEHFAREKKALTPGNLSVLLFRIGPEWFALPTQVFQEVAERRPIHSLPHRRLGIVLGLANIRGELLICVSLGHLLGVSPLPTRDELRTGHKQLLVASWNAERLVFPVEDVQGTFRFDRGELKPAPATVFKASRTCTQAVFSWREKTVGLLNVDQLFATANQNLT